MVNSLLLFLIEKLGQNYSLTKVLMGILISKCFFKLLFEGFSG